MEAASCWIDAAKESGRNIPKPSQSQKQGGKYVECAPKHISFPLTKHCKPNAKLIPFKKKRKSIIGTMKNSVIVLDNIIDSTSEKWEADEAL